MENAKVFGVVRAHVYWILQFYCWIIIIIIIIVLYVIDPARMRITVTMTAGISLFLRFIPLIM